MLEIAKLDTESHLWTVKPVPRYNRSCYACAWLCSWLPLQLASSRCITVHSPLHHCQAYMLQKSGNDEIWGGVLTLIHAYSLSRAILILSCTAAGLTCSGCRTGRQAVSFRLLLKHQLTSGLQTVVFLSFGNVTHRAGAPRQSPVPSGLSLRRVGHVQQARQLLQEELGKDKLESQ